jgi:hypothetical protein
MKKLFAIALAVGLFSGLYGLSFGLGVAYDNIAGPEGTDPYLSIRADVMCKPLPILGFRMGLIQVDLPEDNTTYMFGTGVNADILIYIPMAGMVNPYIPFGFWYYGNGGSTITLKGGLGGEFGFGGFAGYLEGGIEFISISPEGMDSSSENWFYIQAGVRIPVGL